MNEINGEPNLAKFNVWDSYIIPYEGQEYELEYGIHIPTQRFFCKVKNGFHGVYGKDLDECKRECEKFVPDLHHVITKVL